jgi:hypothetical protein
MAREKLFTPTETETFVAGLARGQVVPLATVEEHGRIQLGDACRAAKRPLFSMDGGATYVALPLCPQCGHDYHEGAGTCTGLTARADRITHAVGAICHLNCDWTP